MTISDIIAMVGLGLTVGGIAAEAAGKKQEADAYSAYALYQAQIAKRNQHAMTVNAVRAGEAAQEKQLEQDHKANALIGSQIAAQSVSGVSLGSRSFVLTRERAVQQRNLDAQRIREEGDIEIANYMSLAKEARQAAKYARKEAENAQKAGWLGIASSLMGGAGRLANSWAYRTGGNSGVGSYSGVGAGAGG